MPRRRPRFGRAPREPEPISTPRSSPGPGSVVPLDLRPAKPVIQDSAMVEIYGRFVAAARALAFAEQLADGAGLGAMRYARRDADGSWWIGSQLDLESAREIAALCAGTLHLNSAGRLIPDRGWGNGHTSAAGLPVTELTGVGLLEMVHTAGLNPIPAEPLREAVALLPAGQVAWLVRRALELRLTVTYQHVRLASLFDGGKVERAAYAVSLSAGREPEVPPSLLNALSDNPSVLICRRVERSLLIQHRTGSPLSDRALAGLAGQDTWVMATPRRGGCARLTWTGDPLDATSLLHLGDDHALTDLGGTEQWTQATDHPELPAPQEVTLVRARARNVPVDAVLVAQEDLGLLAALVAGEPLADSAFVVRGRDRHLVSAPGGILQELPIGEALTCVGPGNLYLPIGYRTDPPLPPRARAALFPTNDSHAKVVLPQSILEYDLNSRLPLWRLWAGPVPEPDIQLPSGVLADLRLVEEEVEPGRPTRIAPTQGTPIRALPGTVPRADADWLEHAHAAERAGDFVTAAQLYAQHNDPRRAARMYERHAQESR